MFKTEITKGVTIEYRDGKIVAEAEVAQFINPVLESLEAKIISGEIDPIKGIDVDKDLLLSAIKFLKSSNVPA